MTGGLRSYSGTAECNAALPPVSALPPGEPHYEGGESLTSPLGLAAANAATWHEAMARALASYVERTSHLVVTESGYGHRRRNRTLLTRPVRDRSTLTASVRAFFAACPHSGGMRVEDPFDAIDLAPAGFVRDVRMPVMGRPPGPVLAPAGVCVRRVSGATELAVAERVVVDGFPYPDLEARTPGSFLDPRLLDVSGLSFWLALRDGKPAGAAASYCDGRSVGTYWLATLPEHRSRGVGRAVMSAILGGNRALPAVLTSTEAGRPLYEALGFRAVGAASWWTLVERQSLTC